jgi:hypothetical protein
MSDGKRVVTIPRHDPINAYTLGAIITGAGMSVNEFKKLLWESLYLKPSGIRNRVKVSIANRSVMPLT